MVQPQGNGSGKTRKFWVNDYVLIKRFLFQKQESFLYYQSNINIFSTSVFQFFCSKISESSAPIS